MIRWYCSRYITGCRAALITNDVNVVVEKIGQFSIKVRKDGHKYLETNGFTYGIHYKRGSRIRWRCVKHSLDFVYNTSGKRLAICGGYSYYCGVQSASTNTWRCTRWGTCKSRFILDNKNLVMLTGNFHHTHDAPSYIIRNGVFMKV